LDHYPVKTTSEHVQHEELKLAHDQCEMLENDEKVGLWSMLDSKTRRALKNFKR